MLSTLLGRPYLLPIFDGKGVVLDFFLYALLVGVFLFFFLPISLVLRAARHESNAPIHAEIGLGLYRACIGIAFQMRENHMLPSPCFCAKRVDRFPKSTQRAS